MSLSKLARQTLAEQRWLQNNAQALDPLVQETENVAMAGELGVRELAAVANGAASAFAMVGRPDVPLFTEFAKEAERRTGDFIPQ